MSHPVTLIHYDIGNLLSVERALLQVGADLRIAYSAEEIRKAQKLVLPGVGAFGSCVEELKKRGLMEAIKDAVNEDVPLLGICVGMQMLFDQSEEFGMHSGFGFIPGTVKAIPKVTIKNNPQKIPHIGWVELQEVPDAHFGKGILQGISPGDAVYFVHSFAAYPANEENRLADIYYGGHRLSAMAGRDNVFGTQFHPEKSGPVGLKILENFVAL